MTPSPKGKPKSWTMQIKIQKAERSVLKAVKRWYKHWMDGSLGDSKPEDHPADIAVARAQARLEKISGK